MLRRAALAFAHEAFDLPRDVSRAVDFELADLGMSPLGDVYNPTQRWLSLKRLRLKGSAHYYMSPITPTPQDEEVFRFVSRANLDTIVSNDPEEQTRASAGIGSHVSLLESGERISDEDGSSDDYDYDFKPRIGNRCLFCFMLDAPCDMTQVQGADCCETCVPRLAKSRATGRTKTTCYIPCSRHLDLLYTKYIEMHRAMQLFAADEARKAQQAVVDVTTPAVSSEERVAALDLILTEEYWGWIDRILSEFCREIRKDHCPNCNKHNKLPVVFRVLQNLASLLYITR